MDKDNKKGNFGWAVLGFFFPLIGLILFLVWKNNRKGDSKMAGMGALVSVILSIVFSAIFYLAVWPALQRTIVDSTCATYGENYESLYENGEWYCVDHETGSRINASGEEIGNAIED